MSNLDDQSHNMTTPQAEDAPENEREPPRQHPNLLELRSGQCRFPLGGPRQPARFFCGKPAALPKPYCRECRQRAYVTLRLR